MGSDVTQATRKQDSPDDLLTVPEVAGRLGLTTKYTRDFLLRPGLIRSVRVGKQGPKARYRVRRRDLDDYIDRATKGGVDAPPPLRKYGRAAEVA